jgi:hypothetical protein
MLRMSLKMLKSQFDLTRRLEMFPLVEGFWSLMIQAMLPALPKWKIHPFDSFQRKWLWWGLKFL